MKERLKQYGAQGARSMKHDLSENIICLQCGLPKMHFSHSPTEDGGFEHNEHSSLWYRPVASPQATSNETRKESAKSWAEVPENNRQLMTAVCAELLEAFRDKSESELREEMAILNIKLKVAHKALLREIQTRDGLREELTELRAKLAEQREELKSAIRAGIDSEQRAEAAEAERKGGK